MQAVELGQLILSFCTPNERESFLATYANARLQRVTDKNIPICVVTYISFSDPGQQHDTSTTCARYLTCQVPDSALARRQGS